MRHIALIAVFAMLPGLAAAQVAAPTTAPVAATAPVSYTTSDTDIGTLLDNPATRAVLDKRIPGFSHNAQIDMARSMTLKQIQAYTPEKLTNKILSDVDGDFKALSTKK